MATRVVVLADTHIRAGSPRRLPATVLATLGGADLVLHAGDVVCAELLEELAAFAPTLAVLGNNDIGLVGALPDQRLFAVEGLSVGMIHDSGPRGGREARLRRRFPTAELVVFGHSHVPMDVEGIDGQRLFNPGSPTERRLQPVASFGVLEIDGDRIASSAIIPVG